MGQVYSQKRLKSTDSDLIFPFGFENLPIGLIVKNDFFLGKKDFSMERTNEKQNRYNDTRSLNDLSCRRYEWGGRYFSPEDTAPLIIMVLSPPRGRGTCT